MHANSFTSIPGKPYNVELAKLSEGAQHMSASSYARLAGAIFAIIALLQLARAVAGWPVTVGDVTMPVWPSWVAFAVAGGLAWLGFTARP